MATKRPSHAPPPPPITPSENSLKRWTEEHNETFEWPSPPSPNTNSYSSSKPQRPHKPPRFLKASQQAMQQDGLAIEVAERMRNPPKTKMAQNIHQNLVLLASRFQYPAEYLPDTNLLVKENSDMNLLRMGAFLEALEKKTNQ